MLRQAPPFWVYFGSLVLAFVAGTVNAVGFLGWHHQALSHLSGIITMIGQESADARFGPAVYVLAILVSFFAGCVLSGTIIGQSSLRLGRRYGVALLVESAALFLAVHFLRRDADLGYGLAAFACGLQNAMVSTYSGSSLRTTHMTGMVTDVGIACGHLLRGTPVDWFRFRLYGVVLLGFFGGGLVGTLAFRKFGVDVLLFAAVLTGVTGLAYAAFKHRARGPDSSAST